MAREGKAPPEGRELAVLALTALGVVFGDIGTSPIYAFRESFHPSHGIEVTPESPRVRVTVGRGRSVLARQVTIPYLRLGRHVVRDVPALLLPPEHEDAGSQIGPRFSTSTADHNPCPWG